MGKEEDKAVAEHVSGQSNKPMSAPAHALTYAEVEKELSADAQNGLSHEEAKKRLEEFGRNEFGANKGVQPARILVAQIANSLTLVRDSPPATPGLYFPIPHPAPATQLARHLACFQRHWHDASLNFRSIGLPLMLPPDFTTC